MAGTFKDTAGTRKIWRELERYGRYGGNPLQLERFLAGTFPPAPPRAAISSSSTSTTNNTKHQTPNTKHPTPSQPPAARPRPRQPPVTWDHMNIMTMNMNMNKCTSHSLLRPTPNSPRPIKYLPSSHQTIHRLLTIQQSCR